MMSWDRNLLVIMLACCPLAAQAARPYGAGKAMPADYIADVNAGFDATTPEYDSPPRLLRAYQPIYPLSRLMSGVEGNCTVSFRIDATGATTAHALVPNERDGQIGDQKMCAHSIIALRTWQFAPARRAGTPVPYPNAIQLSFVYGLR